MQSSHSRLPNADEYNRDLQRKLQLALERGTRAGQGPVRVGRFLLKRKIGAGGAGDVYVAQDERLARKVAVKLLRAHADPISQARFERGAQTLAGLSHPNVVKLLEIGEQAGVPFIVMEYIDGGTLRAWLDQGLLDQAQLLSTLISAGRGLVAAHESGFVHRDFKPSNVMLARDGRVLVTDFGLARRPMVETDDLSRELRMAGLFTGTPAYMAPEIFSELEADARSDQFAFCVVAWEAIYGQRPFPGNNIPKLVAAMHQQAPLANPDVRVPRWLRKALERGLARDPDARWPTLAALLRTLEAGGRPRWLAWTQRGGPSTNPK